MRRTLIALACLVALPADAQQRPPETLQNPRGANVIIWRDNAQMREAGRLIDAGVHNTNPALLMPMVSCMVPNGTPAVVTDGGFASSTIMVVAGAQSGCRGVVYNDMIARR